MSSFFFPTRRKKLGAHQPHNFFDPANEEGEKKRLHMAIAALDDMIEWLVAGGNVGIYDATNTTKQRRRLIQSRCTQESFDVMFLESICNDPGTPTPFWTSFLSGSGNLNSHFYQLSLSKTFAKPSYLLPTTSIWTPTRPFRTLETESSTMKRFVHSFGAPLSSKPAD
jgi:hypothetical protein